MEETVYEPLEFFKLPYKFQKKIILKDLDYDSIENLCEAANNSESELAKQFYLKICKNPKIWREKIRIDFYKDFPEEFKEYDNDKNKHLFTPKLYKSFHNAKHLTRNQLIKDWDPEALKIRGILEKDETGWFLNTGMGYYGGTYV